MEDKCDIINRRVITVSGNFGLRTLNPISSLTSWSMESSFLSANCMIEVAEKDLEIEAILKIQSSLNGVLFSWFLVPKDWV